MIRPIVFTLVLAAASGTAAALQSSVPPLAAAQARLAANDAAGAREILQKAVAETPRDRRAWRMLGIACRQLKDYEASIGAFRKAIEIMPADAQSMFDLGLTYAAAGKKDEAFEWLGKARASKRVDMTQMEGDKTLDALRGDSRFAALVPTAADFAEPFVEPVKIIREFDGESANDQFGWIARVIGDVDGDHADDVVTSAPTSGAAGANAGRIYVYSSATGKLLWKADGHPGDQLGTGIEAAGDVNHDGAGDVIAAAPFGDYAHVYSGKDGRVLLTLKPPRTGEAFGRHAQGIGDVNGDGVPDLMVGAPGAPNAAADFAGHAYVFSGKNGAVLLTLTGERGGDQFGAAVTGASGGRHILFAVGAPGAGPNHAGRVYAYTSLGAKPAFVVDADDTGIALGGMFMSVPGDLDGDGVPDLYASDWSNRAKGPSTGRVYVFSGRSGRRVHELTGETAGEGFGTSPSVAGDVDGDGVPDLIVGAWQYAGAAISGGRAYLYNGKTGALIKTFTCKTPGDTFGFDAVGIGDVDHDGVVDLLITSGWSGVHGFHSGRVFIVSSGVTPAKR